MCLLIPMKIKILESSLAPQKKSYSNNKTYLETYFNLFHNISLVNRFTATSNLLKNKSRRQLCFTLTAIAL